MAAVAFLTVLAILGVFLGSGLGQSKAISSNLAAMGGGLLFGIAAFWILPEVQEVTGWPFAVSVAVAVALVLVGLDFLLDRIGHSPRHGVLGPLILATAVHSFLDGWSVRAVGMRPLASAAVTAGLALHKIPEGLALGWLTRKASGSLTRAIVLSSIAESVTLLGGVAEPRAAQSGEAAFGPWWTGVVLALVAGSFLFLAAHTTIGHGRKDRAVYPTFAGGFLLAGVTAWLAHGR